MTVTPAVTRDVTAAAGPSRPARLGARGRKLWDEMTKGVTLPPAEQVLVEEACRLADRLERLDAVLAGESDRWLQIQVDEDGGRLIVVVDKALSESRQQAIALKQLVGELRQLRSSAAAGSSTPVQPPRPAAPAAAPAAGGNGVSGVADLAARIAAKRGGQTAG